MNWGIGLELLVAVGFFELIRAVVLRIVNRRKVITDAAAVVQGMALDLLTPLHRELESANRQTAELRVKLNTLEDELGQMVRWARGALDLLERNGLVLDPPTPLRRV